MAPPDTFPGLPILTGIEEYIKKNEKAANQFGCVRATFPSRAGPLSFFVVVYLFFFCQFGIN